MQKQLKEHEIKGDRTVDMVDYWEMKRIFKNYHNDLITYAKKFSKVKYTKTWQIEDDLNDFNKLLDKCNNELEEISKIKIKVGIKKAYDFFQLLVGIAAAWYFLIKSER